MIKRILNGSFLLLVGNIAGRLAMFLTNIVAAHTFNQELFGQYMTVRNTVSMLENIVSGALGGSTIRTIAKSRYENNNISISILAVFSIHALVSIIIVVSVIYLSPYVVVNFFLAETGLVQGLYVGGFLLLTSIMSIMSQNILIGLERYNNIAASSIMASAIFLPVFILNVDHIGLVGMVVIVSLYFVIDFLIKFIFIVVRIKKLKVKICQKLSDVLLKIKGIVLFSIPLLFSVMLNSVALWYARVLVINSQEGFSGVAVYDAAYQWLTIIMIITGATTSVALPMLSKNTGLNNNKETNKIFYLNVLVNFVLSGFIAMLFIFFSGLIMAIYGDKYIGGENILKILGVASIFYSMSSIFNKYMISIKKTRLILLCSIVSIIIMFSVFLYLGKTTYNLSLSLLSYHISSTLIYLLTFCIIKR